MNKKASQVSPRTIKRALRKKHPNLTLKELDSVFNSIFEIMAETLENGQLVSITNFGSFETREYKQKTYHRRLPVEMPESITIGARKRPFFKAAAALRQRVNG